MVHDQRKGFRSGDFAIHLKQAEDYKQAHCYVHRRKYYSFGLFFVYNKLQVKARAMALRLDCMNMKKIAY